MARNKVQAHEKLDAANMTKVIELLDSDTPITKKAACEHLNISYNTKRLASLIDEFIQKRANDKRLRAKMRSTLYLSI